jgi:hypothetical protein
MLLERKPTSTKEKVDETGLDKEWLSAVEDVLLEMVNKVVDIEENRSNSNPVSLHDNEVDG